MIRPAEIADLPFVQELAGRVFSRFGRYDEILAEYFLSDSVLTFIYETAHEPRERAGFLMLGAERRADKLSAHLHAIAVTPEKHRTGIGSDLVNFAKGWALALPANAIELVLSVSEDNLVARSFFDKHGFVLEAEETWRYPAGQRALRMVCSLRQEAA